MKFSKTRKKEQLDAGCFSRCLPTRRARARFTANVNGVGSVEANRAELISTPDPSFAFQRETPAKAVL